ncbi:hypothetical protein FSARC_11246 [Fusarium sarcochroum]|uniref:NAD-dependent epimerase/dehydratase domain-containing protein n=1 Tax=Fusarium sarcochroum TaxID=1208366 RepID=A0A8H4TGT2_9HYPO|nr:hypothetical protein FSARC_11246 [Fusarium sarcochroum]
MPRQFQFVAVSNPVGPVSSESRKLRHSHAIRQKHAKERRLRTHNYQRNLMHVQAEKTSTPVPTGNSNSFSRMLDYSKDPFSAMAGSLSSQEYFLLHYYVHVVVPQSVAHCGLFNYPGDHEGQVLGDWVGLAITNKDLLDSAVLLSACRSILRNKPDDHELARLALQYKQRGLECLRQSLSGASPMFNVLTIAMSLALAFDEEASGDMGIARQHLRGIFAMADLSGAEMYWLFAAHFAKQYFFPVGQELYNRIQHPTSLLSYNLTPNKIMTSPTPTIPIGSWVLVTGATGFVASHVIRQLLKRGYKVRGTVRDLTQASWLVKDHFKAYVESGDFGLVTVPDLSVDGAYDNVVKGVSAIIHIAAIATFDPNPNNIVPQTVAGTKSILEAAAKEPSVQRIVFTSSIMAALFPLAGDNTRADRDTWNDVAEKAAWAPPPYDASRGMTTYATSKLTAEKEVWKFVSENKLHYTVNVISPSGVIGEPLHVKHADNPVNWVATVFKGEKAKLDTFPAAFFVDIEDIATLHVAATLDPEVKNARLQTWGHSTNWNEFLAILRKLRPEKEFMADYPDPYYLTISTDQSESVALLKKWAGQDGWKSLEDSISEGIESPYFQLK